jgi:hypothetical protein
MTEREKALLGEIGQALREDAANGSWEEESALVAAYLAGKAAGMRHREVQ